MRVDPSAPRRTGRGVTAAVAAAALLAGCTPRPTVTLTLSVTPRILAAGDSVRLVLAMTNPGRDTLHVAFEPGCAWRLSVRHATDGWRAMPVPDACATAAAVTPPGDSTRVTLAPGATWRVERAWLARGEDARHPLVPGAYRAEGSIAQRIERRGTRSTLQLGMAAPSVELVVSAPR